MNIKTHIFQSNPAFELWTEKVTYNKYLRRCETPPSPPAPDPVGIENCKQLFSPLLAFTTQKIATHSTDIISAVSALLFLGRKCKL